MRPDPGTPVRLVMTKWGGRPHWEHEAVFLGRDRFGDWIGAPAGTAMSRPGAAFVTDAAVVVLLPVDPGEDLAGSWWAATFYAPEHPGAHIYVDITDPPAWSTHSGQPAIGAVDLDLDVVLLRSGDVWIDDEDEFEEHQHTLGYPDDVVRAARTSADAVLEAVLNERAPFDGGAGVWLEELARLA